MKKQNKFKHTDFKYEPIRQEKQPFWMHSIDRPVSNNEIKEVLMSFAIVILFGLLVIGLYCIIGG